MPSATTLSHYIVGKDWVTVPYREDIRNGRKAAVYADLGELPTRIKVYAKADEGKMAIRTIERTVRTYQSYYSIITSDIVRWW
jgi:hypothetical protein